LAALVQAVAAAAAAAARPWGRGFERGAFTCGHPSLFALVPTGRLMQNCFQCARALLPSSSNVLGALHLSVKAFWTVAVLPTAAHGRWSVGLYTAPGTRARAEREHLMAQESLHYYLNNAAQYGDSPLARCKQSHPLGPSNNVARSSAGQLERGLRVSLRGCLAPAGAGEDAAHDDPSRHGEADDDA
jgi:hypothetical protein